MNLDPASVSAWLAEAHRCRYLAVAEQDGRPLPTAEELTQLNRDYAEQMQWAERLGHLEHWIDYEPRAMAVDSGARQVAVGTKSGAVYLARQDQSSEWKVTEHFPPRKSDRRAIRGLLFLDDKTLAAATGFGEISSISVADPRAWQPIRPSDRAPRNWQNRCLEMILLPTAAAFRALVLTAGEHIYLVRNDCSVLERSAPHVLLPGWPDTERIVAGRMHHLVGSEDREHIVLLGIHGTIAIYRWPTPDRADLVQMVSVEPPARHAIFQGLAKWPGGLALLASEYVTCLPYSGDQGPRFESDLLRPHWLPSPRTSAITVWQPYHSPGDSTGSVVMYTGSANRGVSVIRWNRDGGFQIVRRPVELPVSKQPTGVRFLAARTQDVQQNGNAPALLAVATWDHRLIISSILHRDYVDDTLKVRADALASSGSRRVVFSRLHAKIKRLTKSALPNGAADPPDNAEFRSLEAGELIRLAEPALTTLNEKPDAAFKWLLAILKRAQELDPQDRSDIYRSVSARLDWMAAEAGASEDVRRFSGFFRKWTIDGPHATKSRQLGWLALSNHRRRLDALQYRTSLLRRRVDPIWISTTSAETPSPGTWTLAAIEAPRQEPAKTSTRTVVLQCRTDGTIGGVCAQLKTESVSRQVPKNQVAAWPEQIVTRGSATHAPFVATGEVALRLEQHGLRITPHGMLERADAEMFRARYHYGPYTRRLVLFHDDSRQRLFALFAFHGWRRPDYSVGSALGPRLCLLELAPARVRHRWTLQVLDVTSVLLNDEIFALEPLPARAGGAAMFIAGAAGSRRDSDAERDAEREPFFQIEAQIAADLRLTVQPIRIEGAVGGGRTPAGSAVDETERNPCRGIIVRPDPGAPAQLMLWAGFDSGDISCYRLNGAGVAHHVRTILQDQSPIRLMTADPSGRHIAYGTAGGTVGVLALDDSLRTADQRQLPMHIVHSSETDSICYLVFFTDERDKLLALSKNGIASIYDVEGLAVNGKGSVLASGHRVDRFPLHPQTRAADAIFNSPSRRPFFIVGDSSGTLTGVDLIFPRGTARRRKAATGCGELWEGVAKDVTAPVPPDQLLEWLRVFDLGAGTGGLHLVRFSLWNEMVNYADRPYGEFIDAFKQLRDEAFYRRPFGRELAKVLWEEGSRFAKALIRQPALNTSESWDAALEAHQLVDNMCNRWIGQERSSEYAVLSTSFKHLFDWEAVELLCSTNRAAAAAKLREFLVFEVIERRLRHGSPIVPFETLRTINAALVRAIVHTIHLSPTDRRAVFETEGRSVDLYDLAILVGELGRRLGSALTPAEPLFTEIARFFASVLLRAPDHSLLIFQILSESRLIKPTLSIVRATLDHATRLREDVLDAAAQSGRADVDVLAAHRQVCQDGLEVFGWACETSKGQIRATWNCLSKKELASTGSYDNAAVLSEMADVFHVANAMGELNQADSDQSDTSRLDKRSDIWLNSSTGKFYRHTRRYFKRLVATRNDLIDLWRQATGGGRVKFGEEANRALTICDRELEALRNDPDLFEPQRSQYADIILSRWRQPFEEPARQAYGLLRVVNRFNRHVYRTEAESLMAAVIDLALQTSPRWLDKANGAAGQITPSFYSLTGEALTLNHAVKDVYDGVTELVADSNLVGQLLAVAYDRLVMVTQRASILDVAIFIQLLKREAMHVGIELRTAGAALPAGKLPGNAGVWMAIARELCQNLKRYGVTTASRAHYEFTMFNEKPRLEVFGERPFLERLSENAQREFANEPADQQLAYLRRQAQATLSTDNRDARRDRNSSGHGLSMIDAICQLLPITFECDVRPAADVAASPFASIIHLEP